MLNNWENLMAEKKKQHYVPKMYLKRFLYNEKQFYLYNLLEMKDIGLVCYKDHCYDNYFYGKDKKWENKLNDKENCWDKTIYEVLNDDYSNLDSLREFAVFQYGRTRSYNDNLLESTTEIYKEYIKTELENREIKCDESIIQRVAQERAAEITSPANNLDLLEKNINEISDLSFVKIHYNTKTKLISSDNPVLFMNQYCHHGAGLGAIGLIIIFPLDPENLAVFYDSKIYSKFRGKMKVTIANDYEVSKINALVLANANEIIYSATPFEKKTFCKKNIDLRNTNLKHNHIDVLGPNTNKMIITHQPTIYHNYNFSFSQIDSFYFNIGIDFRDPVLRKHDVGFEQKLAFKCQDVYIQMISHALPKIDSKKYKIGYEQFYQAMIKYWGLELKNK